MAFTHFPYSKQQMLSLQDFLRSTQNLMSNASERGASARRKSRHRFKGAPISRRKGRNFQHFSEPQRSATIILFLFHLFLCFSFLNLPLGPFQDWVTFCHQWLLLTMWVLGQESLSREFPKTNLALRPTGHRAPHDALPRPDTH